ncbi:conjugative transposon protein TraM [Parapedobacter sp. 10938]|uniref:conjugative transposon protein TraM n=1 Tax=Parapedobacter flavus TaxID=3110225 RepID=UPI002DBE0531|nr:conjugative transposon protein TraM [Parapedobacter sp. 10938]MEC3881833.1 conjugative transposon protein TraM [Parapedobacter sp. 10938]
MAFIFDLAGGGQGVETERQFAGFNTSFPEAESEAIVDSRKQAYEEKDRLASETRTSTAVIDEFDLDNMEATVEVYDEAEWVDDTPDNRSEEDADTEVASLYENFLKRREDRAAVRDRQVSAVTPTRPAPEPRPLASVEPTAREVPEEVEDSNNGGGQSLFFDNLSSGSASIAGNNEAASGEVAETVSINAVIHGEQTIGRSGSFVKMRITDATELSGIRVPANSIVYGLANLSSKNRLDISITSISLKGKPLAVNLSTYDAADGRQGILLSGGESGEVKNDAIDDAISDASMSGIPGGRLINRAARDLFSKKGEASDIVLISNYKVYLKHNRK